MDGYLDAIKERYGNIPENFWFEIRDFNSPSVKSALLRIPINRIMAGTDWTNRIGPPFLPYGMIFGNAIEDNPYPPSIDAMVGFLKEYGAGDWDIEKIKRTFYEGMKINGIDSSTGKLWNYCRPYCMWQESFEEHKINKITFETEVKKIDQLGCAAVAKMWWKAFLPEGVGITIDYLTLLKIDGEWRIVNKTCSIERYYN